MNNKNDVLTGLIIFTLFAFIFGIGLYTDYGNKDVNVVTVTDKEVKRSDEKDRYIVFTKDKEGEVRVYKNTDMTFLGKFNSSDIQSELEIGKTYEIESRGFRIRFLSDYPNIIKVKEVE